MAFRHLRGIAATVAAAAFATAATAQTFTINGKVYMKTPDGKMVEVASPSAASTAAAPASSYAPPARSGDQLEQHQGKRYALVIGNTAYEPPIEQLVNPKKDSRDMCAALKRLGFEVACVENVKTRRELVERVDAFTDKLRRGARENAVGLFYYAGHGVQTGGVNYLLPTGAVIKRERDLEYESMSLNYVMTALAEAKNPFNMVILDACRNNPVPGSRTRAVGDRGGGGGLTSVKGPVGTFVAFATAEGDVSYDGPLNGNGIFTKHILMNIEKPGLKIEDVFKRVTQGVTDETMNMDRGPQVPWISASFRGEFCFVSCRDPGVDDFIARLRIEKEGEIERLQLEKGLIEKQRRLMELELSKRDQAANAELQRLRDEKSALEAEKKRLETSMAAVRAAQQQPAKATLSREEQAQVEQLRREMSRLKQERGEAEEKARRELSQLQAEKTRMESERSRMEAEMKVQQERLKNVRDEARQEEGKKKVFVPPSF